MFKDKDLIALVVEYHKLKCENEELTKKNEALSDEINKLKVAFAEKRENVLTVFTVTSSMLSSRTYHLLNPNGVNIGLEKILAEHGLKIITDWCNGNHCVEVGEQKFYTNPYCEAARSELELMQGEASTLEAKIKELTSEVKWLEGRIEKAGGLKKKRGIIGFKPYWK